MFLITRVWNWLASAPVSGPYPPRRGFFSTRDQNAETTPAVTLHGSPPQRAACLWWRFCAVRTLFESCLYEVLRRPRFIIGCPPLDSPSSTFFFLKDRCQKPVDAGISPFHQSCHEAVRVEIERMVR